MFAPEAPAAQDGIPDIDCSGVAVVNAAAVAISPVAADSAAGDRQCSSRWYRCRHRAVVVAADVPADRAVGDRHALPFVYDAAAAPDPLPLAVFPLIVLFVIVSTSTA